MNELNKIDELLVKELLEALNKKEMTPSLLAEKLGRNLSIETTLRFMIFERWVRQDQQTKMVSITASGQRQLQKLRQNPRL
jgi:DNA-binding PadR family transcriptional regulator